MRNEKTDIRPKSGDTKRTRASARKAAGKEPPAHYRLSSSGSSRWLVCHWSAQHDLPDTSGPAAQAGTITHDLACAYLRGRIESTFELENEVYERTNRLLPNRSRDIARAASSYVEYVTNRVGTKVYETKIEHAGIPDFGGTIDAAILDGVCLSVVDLKTGTWRVAAENNTQLMSYLCLARQIYPQATEFVGTIIQPITNKNPKTASFSGAELDIFEKQVKIASTSDKKQTGFHCRFCPLRPKCVEGTEYANERGWPA